jgi:hypothetical protein
MVVGAFVNAPATGSFIRPRRRMRKRCISAEGHNPQGVLAPAAQTTEASNIAQPASVSCGGMRS